MAAQVCYLFSTLLIACLLFIVRPTESTEGISNDYRMPSGEVYWSPIIEQLSKEFHDHVGWDAQTPPTSDARKILNDNSSEDYRSEMEPIIDAKELLNDWYLEDTPSEMEPIIDAKELLNDWYLEDTLRK